MGKAKILIPKGKFFLRPIAKDSEVKSIYIRYVFHRTSIVRPMANYQCRSVDWNQNGNLGRGEVKASYGVDYKRVNSMLAKRISDIDNALVEYNNAHPNQLTVQKIRDIIDGKPLHVKMKVKVSLSLRMILQNQNTKRTVSATLPIKIGCAVCGNSRSS